MLVLPDDFEPSLVRASVARETAWWFVFENGELLVRTTETGVELPTASDWPIIDGSVVCHLYLGTLRGRPCHAVALTEAQPPPEMVFEGLRGLWSRLDEALLGVAGHALQLIEWDRTHQYCGRCGTPTQRRDDERARSCASCGLIAYPRLSPVVMMRIDRNREILLARAARFPTGMYSVLAGFVEAGETLEQAIHREVAEEVGVQVKNLRYFASQSWPFPHSLMIAFIADYAGGELRADEQEILDVGWFKPGNLPGLPHPMSMARHLIEDFVEHAG